MIGAVVKDNMVVNIITIKEENIEVMAKALQSEIIDARPYGLTIGDLRTKAGWARNAGGEQIILKPVPQKNYDTYSIQQRKIAELEIKAEAAADVAVIDALAILTGEVVK